MPSDYEFVNFTSAQMPNLEALFSQVYGNRELAATYINDRFNTNSFSLPPIGFLAYPKHGNSINCKVPSAYYGVFPTVASFRGVKILIAQSGDTMTHPCHRGKGLFVTLGHLTNAVARTAGIEFIFGFPSPLSLPGFKKHLGWQFPFQMLQFSRCLVNIPTGLLRKKLGFPSTQIPLLAKLYVERLSLNDCSGNPLLQSCPSIFNIPRSTEYLNYKKLNSPLKTLLSTNDLTAALKFDGNINIGEIFQTGNCISMIKLISQIEKIALLSGAIQIRSFFSPESRLCALLSPFGRISTAMPFGYLNFNSRLDPSKLELSLLDFDYF
jgi:hypothetical protein